MNKLNKVTDVQILFTNHNNKDCSPMDSKCLLFLIPDPDTTVGKLVKISSSEKFYKQKKLKHQTGKNLRSRRNVKKKVRKLHTHKIL
jgi:hypothetical protein